MFNNIVIDWYKHQPIIPTNFRKLALLQTQDRHATPQTILQKQWCMLRWQVDKITQVTHDKQIDIQNVKPCDSGQSLRIIVDGPPGIGSTKGELTHEQYNFVQAQANELQDILKHIYDCNEVTTVNEWLCKIDGEDYC